jgi:hypothetical protein
MEAALFPGTLRKAFKIILLLFTEHEKHFGKSRTFLAGLCISLPVWYLTTEIWK